MRTIFGQAFSKIKDVFKRNSYPPFILDKIIKAYINKIHYNNNKVSSEINKLRYFKLPYIGKYSEQVQKKITKLCKQYCNENNVKIVFTSFKVSNYFSVKDATTYFSKSFLVCKLQITNEHIKKDEKSQFFNIYTTKRNVFQVLICFFYFRLGND